MAPSRRPRRPPEGARKGPARKPPPPPAAAEPVAPTGGGEALEPDRAAEPAAEPAAEGEGQQALGTEARPVTVGLARELETPVPAEPAASAFAPSRVWQTGLPNSLTIARRELGSLFVSPIFYVVAALLAIIVTILGYLSPISAGNAFSIGSNIIPLVEFLLVIFAPLFTMRLLAEERRAGTLEMLLTAPVRDWEVVAGKWLGALVTLLASVAFTLVYVVLVSIQEPLQAQVGWFGRSFDIPAVDYGAIWAAYAGLILLGAAYVAIGLLASSLTSNQIIAAVTGVFLLLVLYAGLTFVTNLALSPALTSVLYYLSTGAHTPSFNSGRIALADVAYFVTLTAGALFLTTRVLESRKWR